MWGSLRGWSPNLWESLWRRLRSTPGAKMAAQGGRWRFSLSDAPTPSEVSEGVGLNRRVPIGALSPESDADDSLVQMCTPGRAKEGGVAEVEDPSIRGDHPVALARRGRRHGHDGLVEGDRAHGAGERRVAEVEDPSIRGDQPVAA